MNKRIIMAIAFWASDVGAMAQEMVKLKARMYESDTESYEFELEKNHVLLSGTIKDAHEDLKSLARAKVAGNVRDANNQEIVVQLQDPMPLKHVTQGDIYDLLQGKNYEYILQVHRAYNEGADANPVVIRDLSDEERKRRGEIQARTLDPELYRSKPRKLRADLQDAWGHLKAAHYLTIPELMEKYACISAIMMVYSDTAMRFLQRHDQEHIAMISAINKNRSFADLICNYIPTFWAEEHTLRGHAGCVNTASFSPDGSNVVTASVDNRAKIWNAVTGVLKRTIKAHTDWVRLASFSSDGSKIVTASDTGRAKIWNAQTGALEGTLIGHTHWVRSASFSPDVSKIVTASNDRTAKIWNAQTGVLERTLEGHAGWVTSASFSPDGSKIVTASFDKTAKIWNAGTGVVELTLEGHTDLVRSSSFSPDSSKIVTASGDGKAKIWNAVTGALERTLAGHTGIVSWASFSPDSSKIVTASFDGTAKIWNAQTGALEGTLEGHDDWVRSASFSSGSRIVTASDDETAKIWAPLPTHTMEQALFLQYLQFIKNQGGQPGWVSGWGRAVMDTFEPDKTAQIKRIFPQ